MTGSPEMPDGGAAHAESRPDATASRPGHGPPGRSRSGPAAELGLVAGGLGLVVYLLGFVADVGTDSSTAGPLVLGGGLLAASVALPGVGVRVLVPAAVASVTGALLMLQAVVGGADSTVAVGALVLALLEGAAAVGAVLLDTGLLRARPPRPRRAAAGQASTSPYQPGVPPFAAQQYPGQPYPGGYPGAGHPGQPYAGDQYAGEHAYAQNARYGGRYGVPGYPPPPPYGAPGYDPAVHGSGYGRSEATPDDPPADPSAATDPGDPPRTGGSLLFDDVTTAGATAPPPAATGTGTGSWAVADAGSATGSGSYRAVADRAAPDRSGVSASGAHRSPSTVSWREGAAASTARPPEPPAQPGPAGDRDGDEHTRAIPTVPDER